MSSAARHVTSAKRSALVERQPRLQPPNHDKDIDLLDSSPRMPHHESLLPEGNLSTKSRTADQTVKANNKHISAILRDADAPNKRDSQVSTTSSVSVTKTKRKTHVGPWQLGKTLGKGATSRVRLAKHSITGQTVAIKIVSKKSAAFVQSASLVQIEKQESAKTSADGRDQMPLGIAREIVIMKLIEHPNVINLYDIWENRGELYLVLEYVEGGELFNYVSTNGALPEAEAVRLFRQILAGLSYCHRFNICHRDLKPENILLDRDDNIKLADFGMAALQPANKWLKTSCGSPHYAAPEIICGSQYVGSKADIWSVGVILFAMLNGFLPFDGGNLEDTLRLVKIGEYYLPPNLSEEAQDLIQCILQKRPEKRITMEGIWNHPLLLKWESYHKSLAAPQSLAGPPPPLTIEACGRKIRAKDIDLDILRSLQTLWYGEKQTDLIKQLTSDEPNHEKLFYKALVEFREEQLENYTGDSLQYSTSDYHHAKKGLTREQSTASFVGHARRPSQFSVVSGESGRRHSYYRNPATATSKTTQGSYDPYRASRTQMVDSSRAEGTVTVKTVSQARARASSNASSRQHAAASLSSSGQPPVPAINFAELERLLQQKHRSQSTATSQSSLNSSHRGRIRKSASYKRRVSFQHKRQTSISTSAQSPLSQLQLVLQPELDPSRPVTQGSMQGYSNLSRSTPSLPTPTHPTQHRFATTELDLHKPRAHSHIWKDDTRKVSAELGKICEEAFNRTSVSSTSDASHEDASETPATTWSTSRVPSAIKNRPLPLTPALHDLVERRQRIIETWGDADAATLADIVATLDRKIEEERQKVNDIRAASDPIHNNSNGLFFDLMGDHSIKQKTGRAVSDPPHRKNPIDSTIRLVTPDPLSPISRPEPLTLRKNKALATNSLRSNPADLSTTHYDSRLYVRTELDTIDEIPRSPIKPTGSDQALNRKWSWLGKKATLSQENLERMQQQKSEELIPSLSGESSERPRPPSTDVPAVIVEKRKWFQKMFGKKNRQAEPVVTEHEIVDNDSDGKRVDDTQIEQSTTRKKRSSKADAEEFRATSTTTPIEIQQNWFAKIFHVKPASRILVMDVNKARARKELVKILRDWRRYGLRDVVVERRGGSDIIRGRVDECNYLHIRPVNFHAHVFTVLERGRSSNLSVVRFTQEKGAASSFYRVVSTLQAVLHENGLLVINEQKKKGIIRSMKESGM